MELLMFGAIVFQALVIVLLQKEYQRVVNEAKSYRFLKHETGNDFWSSDDYDPWEFEK